MSKTLTYTPIAAFSDNYFWALLGCPFRQRSAFSFWLVCHPDRGSLSKIRAFRSWIVEEAAIKP